MVALTGASSFTGAWIGHALFKHGFDLKPLYSNPITHYAGLKKVRVDLLRECHDQDSFDKKAETGNVVRWIEKHKPDVWIHHHHHMTDFRLSSYDMRRATEVCVEPLPLLVEALKATGCKGIVASGSYFEQGERGSQSSPTNYAISKSLVWQKLLELSHKNDLTLAKIVIPNPIGPLENLDRLIPSLIRASKQHRSFHLPRPQDTSVNISVGQLAAFYVETVKGLMSESTPSRAVFRPEGLSQTTLQLSREVCVQLISRLGLEPCQLRGAFEESSETKVNCYFNSVFWDWYSEVMVARDVLPLL